MLLGGGIVATTGLTHVCDRLLQSKATGTIVLLLAIKEFSVQITATLLVALFLFLLQWYVLRRMQRLPQ